MTTATLKSLHIYLRLLENTSDLKRKMPASINPRTVKEGLVEICQLVGLDTAALANPHNIAEAIGPSRFVMIWGEPSATAHVTHIFDSSKVLLMVLADPGHYEPAKAAQSGPAPPPQRPAATGALQAGWASRNEAQGMARQESVEPETPLENLKTLLAGNLPLTCRLFRVLFEHMLGFTVSSGEQQGSAGIVNQMVGNKEHLKSFVATLMFVLGSEIDRENLMSFMLEQGLFSMQIFERLVEGRDYCQAYYSFRKAENAFAPSAAEAEKQIHDRVDQLNARYGGKPYGAKLLEGEDPDKISVDSCVAAVDVLEVMAFTPWGMSLNTAVSVAPSNSVRSIRVIAGHFERAARGTELKETANKEIANHLLAFARQFSADAKSD